MKRRKFLRWFAAALGVAACPVAASPVRNEFAKVSAAFNEAPSLVDQDQVVMMHIAGGKPCGYVGLLMTEIPSFGAAITRSQFRHLDGKKSYLLSAESTPICGHCGGRIHPVREGIRKRISGISKYDATGKAWG